MQRGSWKWKITFSDVPDEIFPLCCCSFHLPQLNWHYLCHSSSLSQITVLPDFFIPPLMLPGSPSTPSCKWPGLCSSVPLNLPQNHHGPPGLHFFFPSGPSALSPSFNSLRSVDLREKSSRSLLQSLTYEPIFRDSQMLTPESLSALLFSDLQD